MFFPGKTVLRLVLLVYALFCCLGCVIDFFLNLFTGKFGGLLVPCLF
jgi:hypothetical protein